MLQQSSQIVPFLDLIDQHSTQLKDRRTIALIHHPETMQKDVFSISEIRNKLTKDIVRKVWCFRDISLTEVLVVLRYYQFGYLQHHIVDDVVPLVVLDIVLG